MKSSARNQLAGLITAVSDHYLTLQCGAHSICAAISPAAAARLRPQIGMNAVAMFKASAIMLLSDTELFSLSADNCIPGVVSRLEPGAVNHIISLDLGDKQTLSAQITLHSSETLDIQVGQKMTAVFAAEQVVVAVFDPAAARAAL